MMSYNTRRSGGFGNQPQQPQHSVGSIGQRRPVVTNNFVPGGQLNPQNKPDVQMSATQQQHLRPPQKLQPQQQQVPPQNAGYRTQNYQQQQQQQQQPPPLPPQTQPVAPLKAEPTTPKPIVQPIIQGTNPPNPDVENAGNEAMDVSGEDTPKRKPFWARSGNKISKKEKVRRRNIRLSKMLQPKNAVMILNELVKNTSYMVDEIAHKIDSNQFKATVIVEGAEHVGWGRSKIQAKNSAAENALKQLIKSNKLSEMKKDDEGNEKMDVTEDGVQPPLPWQHVASFALFKLFCSWGEDPNSVKGLKIQSQLNNSEITQKQHENKPAKKMPENPETMNPLMLLNQMVPHASFEEIGKSGSPPNITYSFRCTVNEHTFIGTGPNKKAAKKQAAFGACNRVLNINYPTDVYVPIY